MWQTLPLPAAMPPDGAPGELALPTLTLRYVAYGAGAPVVLLHGGAGNGEHFANQIPALAPRHRVIVVDARGHGRSTRPPGPLRYHDMAEDVVALLDHLGIARAAIVGWSDGGIVGLDLAIHHPERLTRLFAFGANADASGMMAPARAELFDGYFARCRADYARLAPAPRAYESLRTALRAMWAREPRFTRAQLAAIGVPTAVAVGEHDELIRPEHTRWLAGVIPGAQRIIVPGTSHFAMWQDPAAFNAALLAFLDAP